LRLLKNKNVSVTLLILIAVSLTYCFLWLGMFSRVESTSFDHRVGFFRSDKIIHEDVVIVLIDEKSLQKMSPELGRWPWPRSAYRDLIDFFSLANSQFLAFDILFTEQQEAGDLSQDDQALIDATQRAGNVIHAMQVLRSTNNEEMKSLPTGFKFSLPNDSSYFFGQPYDNYLLPIEGLYKASRGLGFLGISPDEDGVYRRIRLFNQYQDNQILPSLSSAMVMPLIGDNQAIRYEDSKAKIGDFEIPLDGDGNFLINPYGQIITYSASDIFTTMKQIRAGESENLLLDPSDFDGKLVLLGASAIGLLDVKATSLASKEAGVFLHAYTAANLLEQDFLRILAPLAVLGLVILFCAITTISIIFVPKLALAALAPLISIFGYMGFAYSMFVYNTVLPIAIVNFSILLSLLLSYSFRTYQEKFSKLKVRKMLGQYVSPRVLTEVIDNQDDLHAEIGSEETLTILFSDIRGFTNISESLEANQVVELLNIYFSEMTDIIFEHDGTLDKFIGDAIMTFWGAPIKSSEHALDAVKCAIQMSKRLGLVNSKLTEKNYPPVSIGIGIHTGKVVLGNIGSDKKLDYTIIGDSVNLASRLEGLTKNYGCMLVISEDTYNQVQTSLSCILIDKVRVKGKQRPVNLYIPTESFKFENNISTPTDRLKIKMETAFDFYLKRNWDEAEKCYGEICDCKLTRQMQERCRQNRLNEPDGQWDGVYTFTTK
jgi:adenylate cyclase